jgi:hypothetical protein
MTGRPETARPPTQEAIELPAHCSMVDTGGSYRVYWGKKQVLVGEGLTEEDAIISAYKGLIKNFLRDAP